MSIERDDRQTHVEWMIDEFQQARRRRLVTVEVTPVESRVETDRKEIKEISAPSAAGNSGESLV
jgi:hypothetical protein